MNALAHGLGAKATGPVPIVCWDKKEKVGLLNTIRRGIEALGRIRDNTSALGEKAHQLPKHCMEMSKGQNKTTNSLRQAQRLEDFQLREMHRTRQQEITAAPDCNLSTGSCNQELRAGVQLRGTRTFGQALPDLADNVVARINHLIREVVRKEVESADASAVLSRTSKMDMMIENKHLALDMF